MIFMEYGYARASTDSTKQDIDRQRRELMLLGIKKENIFWEYESGIGGKRERLSQLLETVRQGDTIACTEISRLSRSTKEEIDPMTMAMLKMMGVFAQLEREITIQRIKSGLANAKAKGKTLGRRKTTIDDIPQVFFRYYPKFANSSINLSEFARLTNLSRNSIYKYLSIVEEKPQKCK